MIQRRRKKEGSLYSLIFHNCNPIIVTSIGLKAALEFKSYSHYRHPYLCYNLYHYIIILIIIIPNIILQLLLLLLITLVIMIMTAASDCPYCFDHHHHHYYNPLCHLLHHFVTFIIRYVSDIIAFATITIIIISLLFIIVLITVLLYNC